MRARAIEREWRGRQHGCVAKVVEIFFINDNRQKNSQVRVCERDSACARTSERERERVRTSLELKSD